MVLGVESRGQAVGLGGDNQRHGSGKDVPSEEELGALFEQAMKAQQAKAPSSSSITPDEQQKFLGAMKDPEFRSLLNDYMQEISDPKHRAETEQYLAQLESEQRVPTDKQLVRPTPGFVVKTKWRERASGAESKVFVNICSSDKLQPPSSTRVSAAGNDGKAGTSWNLPYSVGPERMESDKGGASVATFDVCFHPRTLEFAKVQLPFRDMVVKIGLDAIEPLLRETRRAPNGMLARAYHVLKGVAYKSGDPVTMCLHKTVEPTPSKPKDKPVPTKKAPVSRSNQSDEGDKVIDVVVDPKAAAKSKTLDLREEEDSAPLMREVASTKTSAPKGTDARDRKLHFQMIYRGKFELMHHMQAEHDNVVPADRNRPKELVIEVDFPLATSAKGIDLDVSESAAQVAAKDYDALEIPLPYPVIESKGSAKFDKKRRKLVVTLPVQPPPQPKPKAVSLAVQEDDGDSESDTDDTDTKIRNSEPHSNVRQPTEQPRRVERKEDEFMMLRETTLMVANDPQLLRRREEPSELAPVLDLLDDLPPLESCSEDEDEEDDSIEREQQESEDQLENMDQTPVPVATIPPYTTKETATCVSFIVSVAGIAAESVRLKFSSPTAMDLQFEATGSTRYALCVDALPHAIDAVTAEFHVASENMVVVLTKQSASHDLPTAKSAHESEPSAGVDPVLRFQNDLLYELD